MSFNGSGVFSRLYSWVTDAGNNINIRADRMDQDSNDIASGLSNCITKDGQQTLTANIPFNNFKITGLGNGSASTDSATLGQVQSQLASYAVAGGTANAITVTMTPTVTSLVDGQEYTFRATNQNTAATTFKVDATLAKNIYLTNSNSVLGGEILANGFYTVRYYQASDIFILLNPSIYPMGIEQSIASAATTDLGSKSQKNIILVTGTTGITSFGSSAITQNPIYFVRFSGILTITNNASSLILPGGSNITTAAGDSLIAKYEGSGNWRVLQYFKADGTPVGTTGLAKTGASNTFTGAQIGSVTALTSSTNSIAIDLSVNNCFSHALTENTTLANPSNAVAGQSGQISFTQNGSAAKTLAFGTNWKEASSGTAPSISTTLSAINVLSYYVVDSTHIWYTMLKGGVA